MLNIREIQKNLLQISLFVVNQLISFLKVFNRIHYNPIVHGAAALNCDHNCMFVNLLVVDDLDITYSNV